MPARADRLGTNSNIEMETRFSSQYSPILDPVPRMLSSGNKKSVDLYISYVSKHIKDHNLLKRTRDLFDTLNDYSIPPQQFPTTSTKLYNLITEILLSG